MPAHPYACPSQTLATSPDLRNLNHFRICAGFKDLPGERLPELDRQFRAQDGNFRPRHGGLSLTMLWPVRQHRPALSQPSPGGGAESCAQNSWTVL